jgi:hypothetical protein
MEHFEASPDLMTMAKGLRCVIPGTLRLNSLNRMVLSKSTWMIQGFHLPETTSQAS